MAVSKVELGGETLIDISGDTVTPETLAEGATAHNSAGVPITGTMKNLSEVDASKVIFDEEVTTGYAVGNIKLTNGKGVLAEKGATLLQVMKNIWTKANPPAVEPPSVTVSISMSGSYEAGYPISQRTYTATFDKGSYEYDDDTGVKVTKWVIDGKETTTSAVSMSGTLSSITVTENTNTRITATAHHTAGIVPKDSLGGTASEHQISSGSVTGYSAYLTGYRNTFYGVLTSKDKLTNSNIRTVCWRSTMKQSNANWSNGKTFTISIPKSTDATPIYRVLIAYPATLRDLTEVIDKNDSNANIVSGFTLVKDADGNLLKIGGYQNYSPIEYKVYVQDFANPYDAANTYTVKI